MRQSITPTKKVLGEVRVPGERVPAECALLLAAIAEGESRVRFVPPSALRVAACLRAFGVEIEQERDGLVVRGKGLTGLSPADDIVDAQGWGASGLLLLAILAGQRFVSRVRLGEESDWAHGVLSLLEAMGMGAQRETGSVYAIGKAQPSAAEHALLDIGADEKLAVLVASLYCEGVTQMRESSKNRNRMERFLRQREVVVERRRSGEEYVVSTQGGQVVQPLDVDVAGDLNLAYPLMLPALALKGSHVVIKGVAVRSGQRHFLELLRQIGGEFEMEDRGEETCDLSVHPSELKSTRVAGQRAENVMEQVALLAALATRVPGEIVIRDVQTLREGAFDRVQHLFESLRALQVRIGEFPEGIVIKGGFPVMGGQLDARGDADLARAFALLGLWAEGEVVVDNAQGIEDVHPEFFTALAALKEKRR
mgnify:CR=1 FL=1